MDIPYAPSARDEILRTHRFIGQVQADPDRWESVTRATDYETAADILLAIKNDKEPDPVSVRIVEVLYRVVETA